MQSCNMAEIKTADVPGMAILYRTMEDKVNMIESLLESSAEYAKTSIELAKLKTVEKAADIVSTLIPHLIVFGVLMSFLLLLNLGLAFWLGELLYHFYYGFFIVAGFDAFLAVALHFFLHKQLKQIVSDYIVKQLLK